MPETRDVILDHVKNTIWGELYGEDEYPASAPVTAGHPVEIMLGLWYTLRFDEGMPYAIAQAWEE